MLYTGFHWISLGSPGRTRCSVGVPPWGGEHQDFTGQWHSGTVQVDGVYQCHWDVVVFKRQQGEQAALCISSVVTAGLSRNGICS